MIRIACSYSNYLHGKRVMPFNIGELILYINSYVLSYSVLYQYDTVYGCYI